jgi:hypothetical protein
MENFNPALPRYQKKEDIPSSEQKNFRDDTESGVGFVRKEAWDFWRQMKHYQKLIDESGDAAEGLIEPETVSELMEDCAKEDELRLAHIELTDEERAALASSLQEKNFTYSVIRRFAGRGMAAYIDGSTLTHDGSHGNKEGDSYVEKGDVWRAGRRDEFTEVGSIKDLVDRGSLKYGLNDVAFSVIEKEFGIENITKMEHYFLDRTLDSVVVYPKGKEEGVLIYSQNGNIKTRFVSFCELMYGEHDNNE